MSQTGRARRPRRAEIIALLRGSAAGPEAPPYPRTREA